MLKVRNSCFQIARWSAIIMRNHPEYKVKVSMKKVNEALDKVRIMPFDSNIADGMTDCEHDIIFYNRRAIKNWSIGYKKLVLLHELAHYFTKKVSGVSGAHCRTWFFWLHVFYAALWEEPVARALSLYNLAKYTGPMKDSSIAEIAKFGAFLCVEEVYYDVLGEKNYCSNLVKRAKMRKAPERVVREWVERIWKLCGENARVVDCARILEFEKPRFFDVPKWEQEARTKVCAIWLGLIPPENVSEEETARRYRRWKVSQSSILEKKKTGGKNDGLRGGA